MTVENFGVADRVQFGVSVITQLEGPLWFKDINLDVLDQLSGSFCVGGQLAGSYRNFVLDARRSLLFVNWELDHQERFFDACGLLVFEPEMRNPEARIRPEEEYAEEYAALTEEWKSVISALQSEMTISA